MLKISIVDSHTQRRMVLEGKLIVPWISELRAAWKTASADPQGRELIIDMANVTDISQEGENVLLQMIEEGAKFRCRGVLTKHVVQQLTRRNKKNSNESMHAADPFETNSNGSK